MTVALDGENLTIAQIVAVARQGEEVILSPQAQGQVRRARHMVDDLVEREEVVYGITTGFGKFADIIISGEDTAQLQWNLIASHATGVGEPFSQEVVRAIMLLRANALAKGHSGIRLETLELVVAMLNGGVHPVIPQQGSVGASGDLAPLSHMVLVMLGEGEAWYKGRQLAGKEALVAAGLAPMSLAAKEGLALINGTQAMTAVGALALAGAQELVDIADLAAAMTLEALEGLPAAFDPRIQQLRPHPGQAQVAANILGLVADSEILARASHGRVQDAYSLRCVPQVHGASRDALRYVAEALSREFNSVTDNPLLFPDEGDVISGGNFHGQPVALAMEMLGMAVAELANISERRIERLVNPGLSGLPAFLTHNAGLNSGFMIAQYTAAALVSENKVLAHPAAVDSIPTSANQEDHVSMGTIAARKAQQILTHAQTVLAIELLVAAQGMDFRYPFQPGRGTGRAHKLIRHQIPPLLRDRVLYPDITKALELVKGGELLAVFREE